MLVQEDENARRLRDGRRLEKLNVVGIIHIEALARKIASVAHHRVHGIASQPPGPSGRLLSIAEDLIRRTLINAAGFAGVRPQAGFGQSCGVGVVGVQRPSHNAVHPIEIIQIVW